MRVEQLFRNTTQVYLNSRFNQGFQLVHQQVKNVRQNTLLISNWQSLVIELAVTGCYKIIDDLRFSFSIPAYCSSEWDADDLLHYRFIPFSTSTLPILLPYFSWYGISNDETALTRCGYEAPLLENWKFT